jgi:hypothetical protein
MKLIQIQAGKRTELQVLRVAQRPEQLYLILEGVYARAPDIEHFLLADEGTEKPVEIENDCSSQPPFIAIVSKE